MKTLNSSHRVFRQASERPHLLQEVMRTSQALVAVFSRQVGMPSSRVALLRLLAIAGPGGVGVMTLAREAGVNAAAITRQVQALEGEQLVARRVDPRDARRHSVVLTSKGLRTFRDLHERGHAFEQALRADVPAEDIATATRVLGHLRAMIERLR
jgi:DNA-binding MarR family transcriptional regulator